MGQGPGRLQTILPWLLRSPNLACTNEATPRGESPEAIRPDTEGEETPRGESPEAIRPDTEDTHAHARARNRLADPQRSESARRPSAVRVSYT